MKKILILTAAFGDGHNTAARNIRDALEHICDDVKVEVLDLFEASYGALNTLAQKTYLGMVQYALRLWGSFYSLMENPVVERNLGSFTRLANALEDIVHETQPDGVVSTYPVYGHVIRELYRDHAERPFRFITVITDSISVNSAWYRAPSDFFCVPNEATADVLRRSRVPEPQIKALGFPTNLAFAHRTPTLLTPPVRGVQRKILYIINTGKKHSGNAIDRLLDLPDTHLTVTVGRDPELIDFYGHHGFDCICITDHLADPRRLIGKLSELANFSLGQNQVGELPEGAGRDQGLHSRQSRRSHYALPRTGCRSGGQTRFRKRAGADHPRGAYFAPSSPNRKFLKRVGHSKRSECLAGQPGASRGESSIHENRAANVLPASRRQIVLSRIV